MLLCSVHLCFTPGLNFGPTSRQSCLTNTPGSEIKLRRGIFSLDLAARHRRAGAGVTAASTGMLPGKGAGGPRSPELREAARGRDPPRLCGRSNLLLRRPRTCQGVSSSLSSFSSITRSNAGCRMPHPCGAASLTRARCPERGDVAVGGAGGKGPACPPSLPPFLPPPAAAGRSQPAPRLGRVGCCIGAGVAWRALAPLAAERGLNRQENAEIRRTRKIKPHKIKIRRKDCPANAFTKI